MSDFTEKYRKKDSGAELSTPPAPSPAIETLKAAAKEEYKAYNTSAHPELEMWVRPNAANEWTDISVPYAYRNHMISDGSGFVISMHFNTPVISVVVHGRNLNDLWRKLMKHEVDWIMEYDARKWEALPEDAPCITGIAIMHAPVPGKRVEDGALPGEKNPVAKPSAH